MSCCCCCPPAVTALLYLWTRSGFSKGTVAAALTFFPPEPALYEFERRDPDGNLLTDKPDGDEKNDDNEDVDVELGETSGSSTEEPLGETKGQTKEQLGSPAQQLSDQAASRKRRARERGIQDTADAAAGNTYKLRIDARLQVPPHDVSCVEAVKIPWSQGRRKRQDPVYIAAVIFRVPPAHVTPHTKTLIYSHGNATDLGAMFPLQVILANSLQCNVVMYDYSGYGESGGVPDEHHTYRDLEEVYDYVWQKVAGQESKQIVIYGQSVGSGPCCYLAAKEDAALGGMILHSPFTSGMRVLTPSRALACLDIYPNIDRIKQVKCPVMILHGRLDQEVDISHGQELYRAVPPEYQREPWWVPDRGHNDITDGPAKLSEYVRRIRAFMEGLSEEQPQQQQGTTE